jgi:hypothetical protein
MLLSLRIGLDCHMVFEINRFVNWVRRRNPEARTWRDNQYDLSQFAAVSGIAHPIRLPPQVRSAVLPARDLLGN